MVAHNQQFTREWWSTRRSSFELFISPLVIDEVGKGDPTLALQRLQYVRDLAVLEISAGARELALEFLRVGGIPKKAELDAIHIAVAAVHGLEYLLTWNCTHIANGVTLPTLYEVCRRAGYEPPLVCTPLELLG